MKKLLLLFCLVFINTINFAQQYVTENNLPYYHQGHLTSDGTPVYDGGFKISISEPKYPILKDGTYFLRFKVEVGDDFTASNGDYIPKDILGLYCTPSFREVFTII